MKDIGQDNFLDGVEMGGNSPVVLSRWGFKRIEIDGKIYLLARTEEELISDIAATENIDVEIVRERLPNRPYCSIDQYNQCHQHNGCRRCQHEYASGWFCDCKD